MKYCLTLMAETSRLPRAQRLLLAAGMLLCMSLAQAQSAPFNSSAGAQESFPDPKSSYLKAAPYISAEQVRRVVQSVRVSASGGAYTGMHKDQVRQELGHPHFDEGIGRNKVWNYIFNLQTSTLLPAAGVLGLESQPLVCQFKVTFNDADLVSATAWNRSACAAVANTR